MFMLIANEWNGFGPSVLVALISALLTATFTAIILNYALVKSSKLGEGLMKTGIYKIRYESGKLSEHDKALLFGLNGNEVPNEIDLLFLTGDSFVTTYKSKLHDLQNKGCQVKILIANPMDCSRAKAYEERGWNGHGPFCTMTDRTAIAKRYATIYNDRSAQAQNEPVAYLERTYMMVSTPIVNHLAMQLYKKSYDALEPTAKIQVWSQRISEYGDHVMQAVMVRKVIQALNAELVQKGNQPIQLRHYNDEYRVPIMIGKYNCVDKKTKVQINNGKILLWSNINAPIKETTKSVSVFGKWDNKNSEQMDKANYVSDIKQSFEYLFELYSDTQV